MLFMILLGLVLAPANVGNPLVPAPQEDGSVLSNFGSNAPRKECANPSTRMADERQRGNQARRLDELPPGRLELAVLREVDGCVIPAVVHEGIGGNRDPEGADRR